jgi:hypothetical protein
MGRNDIPPYQSPTHARSIAAQRINGSLTTRPISVFSHGTPDLGRGVPCAGQVVFFSICILQFAFCNLH